MWLLINGFDMTSYLDYGDIQITQTQGDPSPKAQVTIYDQGSQLSFAVGMECIVWNEAAPAEITTNPNVKPAATPAHNLVRGMSNNGSGGGQWATTGALSILTGWPGNSPTFTFSNTTYSGGNNYEYITSVTPSGYVHPGQQYMLSVYATISVPLVNATSYVAMQFQDAQGNLLGSPTTLTFSSTTGNVQQQVNVHATAPAGAAYVQCWLGGQATVSGTNSGSVVFGSPQCEPMWFTAGIPAPVTYPTPDCNIAQADCAVMPDGTISRAVRLFSGFINAVQISYDGPSRTWQLSCAGPAALLESGLINGTYVSQYDTAILSSVISTYFSTQIATNAPNIFQPTSLTQGALLSSVSYNDNTLREVLNGLSDASGYVFYIDPYYRLYYQPSFFDAATFVLTDGTADNSTSFNYYDYTLEYDGTQLKRRIKIIGGTFHGSYTDVFSGNGSTTQFNLTLIPDAITSLTVGGTTYKVGAYGRDSFGATYSVLVNIPSQYIVFSSAPASGTNNIVVTYTFQAPVTTQTSMQSSAIVSPAYALPFFDSKINDSNITDLTTATLRGIAEIVKFGSPLTVLKFKSSQFAPAGSSIYFTSSLDSLANVPVQVQSVTGAYLGAGLQEFQYVCGTAYQPTLVDHIRNANKSLNRQKATANVTAIQQYDVVATETVSYRDSISATVQTVYATSVYGTGHYGSNAYGGSTGAYGNAAATYGQSTLYG